MVDLHADLYAQFSGADQLESQLEVLLLLRHAALQAGCNVALQDWEK
jgi:hypothetical protein